MKKNSYELLLILALLLLCGTMSVYLYRPLWFDEALTIMNFAAGKSLHEIYGSYIIPNNQIIYTMLLSIWTEITLPLKMNFDFASRLLSFAFSIISVIALCFGFRRQTGGRTGIFLIAASVILSFPFMLYGTAARGYQLSFMLLIFLAWSLKNITRRATWSNLCTYAVLCLLLTGTIPTNLLGIGMAVALFLPELWGKWKKLIAVSAIPFIVFGLFYLPIWESFIKVCDLNEGLDNRFSAAIVPYIAFIANYPILIALGTWGWTEACKQRKINYRNLFRLLCVFMWMIPCFVLKVAPFYRVFYPCFAILILLFGFGIRHWVYLFLRRKSAKAQKIIITVILLLIFGNFMLISNEKTAQKIQYSLNLTPENDDFFMPYYAEEKFFPPAVINRINREYINQANLVFLTFEADSRALHFYAVYGDSDSSKYRLDGPKFKITYLPFRTLIVLPLDGDIDKYIRRFNLQNRQVRKLFTEGRHEVWEVL